MTRNLTGSILAAVLIAIILVKHTALGFCLCTSEYFVNDCSCGCEQAAAEPGCNGRSCDGKEAPEPEPCDDCSVPVDLDVGDFFWSSEPFSTAEQDASEFVLPTENHRDFGPPATLVKLTPAARGAPPGGPPVGLLRTIILRL